MKSLFATVFIFLACQALGEINLREFKRTAKKAHCAVRRLHGKLPIRWDKKIAAVAQAWCNKLAAEDKLEHNPDSEFGENLWKSDAANSSVRAGEKAVKAWYDEVKDYDWNNPVGSEATEHFTQVIWKSSTRLGCGIATKDAATWVCCNYNPPGNVEGQFEANVPQLKKKGGNGGKGDGGKGKGGKGDGGKKKDDAAHDDAANDDAANDDAANDDAAYDDAANDDAANDDAANDDAANDDAASDDAANGGKGKGGKGKGGKGDGGKKKDDAANDDAANDDAANDDAANDDAANDDAANDDAANDDAANDEDADEEPNEDNQALKAHNAYRALHGVGPMTWDEKVATFAQNYCKKLAAEDKFEHSKGSGFGENLYKSWGMGSEDAAQRAVKGWYDEIKDYDWGNPVFSSKTGHFTQVVWKSSTLLGCGIATKDDATWVCCNYSPPGNYAGQFEENVPKLVKA